MIAQEQQMVVFPHLPDVRQEGEGQEEPRHKTADVSKVVDPREQAEREEEDRDGEQFSERSPRSLEDLPALKQLHKQAGQDAEQAARRTHLEHEPDTHTVYTETPDTMQTAGSPTATTSALYGRNMAEARLPVMPLSM